MRLSFIQPISSEIMYGTEIYFINEENLLLHPDVSFKNKFIINITPPQYKPSFLFYGRAYIKSFYMTNSSEIGRRLCMCAEGVNGMFYATLKSST